MMKFSHALTAALLLIAANNVSAAFIDGDIGFGTAVGAFWTPADNLLNTGTATTADADGVVFNDGSDVSSFDEGLVTSAFGDYVGTLGAFVDFNDFVFDPLTPGTFLWSFTSGANTYDFSMTTITIVSQTSNSISLEGTGTAFITGFDPTGGDFSLTLNQNGQAFSFSSSAGVVPLPPAVWLFGSGLLGMIGIARRKKMA
jgi:hypothetical protein